jgi:hypothetical protein
MIASYESQAFPWLVANAAHLWINVDPQRAISLHLGLEQFAITRQSWRRLIAASMPSVVEHLIGVHSSLCGVPPDRRLDALGR